MRILRKDAHHAQRCTSCAKMHILRKDAQDAHRCATCASLRMMQKHQKSIRFSAVRNTRFSSGKRVKSHEGYDRKIARKNKDLSAALQDAQSAHLCARCASLRMMYIFAHDVHLCTRCASMRKMRIYAQDAHSGRHTARGSGLSRVCLNKST